MRYLRSVLIPAVLFLLPGYASAGWVQQQSGTTTMLDQVFFVSPQIGWVAGDSNFVLWTTDGGSHWGRSTVDTAMNWCRTIWFLDANHGWAAGSGDRYSGLLFATTDGGVNWQLKKRDSLGISYVDVKFTTPLKGWLVGSIFYSSGYGTGFLFHTTDGGESWALKDSCTRMIYWEVSFADTLFGLLAAGNPGFLGNLSEGFMKRSYDGGASWQRFADGNTMFDGVRFSDVNHAWRSEYFYAQTFEVWSVSKTNDRGVNWSRIFTRASSPFSVTDSLHGWLLTRDTLFGTTDGGGAWTSQVPPGWKEGIFFVDSLTGWIVGYPGLILHTTDGGSGVWEEPSRLTPNASRLLVSPNPFTSFTTLPGHSSDRFSLYDVSGRKVGVYRGEHIGEGLKAGVYFVRALEGKANLARIVKIR
jgi:photosystem II stability/assembly factor-like uncharacterized protein